MSSLCLDPLTDLPNTAPVIVPSLRYIHITTTAVAPHHRERLAEVQKKYAKELRPLYNRRDQILQEKKPQPEDENQDVSAAPKHAEQTVGGRE